MIPVWFPNHFHKEDWQMPKKRVVLTGASGYIAQRMIQPLQERYDLVCLDIVDKTRDGKAIPNNRIADLANR